MHAIQDLVLRNMDQPEVIAEAVAVAPTDAVDAAFMVVGLLDAKGEREAARGLAVAIAAGLARARTRQTERLEANARRLGGGVARPFRADAPATGVRLSSLYVPRRFG